MTSEAFETILAKLYTDIAFLQLFLDKPEAALADETLLDLERQSLYSMDKAGLILAHRSFVAKKSRHSKKLSAHHHTKQQWFKYQVVRFFKMLSWSKY